MQRLSGWLRFNWFYFRKPPWDTGIAPPELMEFIRFHPPGRALDLGCGTGTNLLALGQSGWQVTGVDFAIKAVTAARRKLSASGIPGDVRVGDVTRLETIQAAKAARYDLVLDIGCYHTLAADGRAAYRRNLPEILTPGGYYLLYGFWTDPAAASQRPSGITQADLEAFQAALRLDTRQDGLDRGHASVWLRFCFEGR